MRQLVYNILLVLCIRLVNSEIFSSIEELETQFNNEKLLLNELEKFANKVKDDYVYRKLKTWKNEHNEAEADISRYITNPLNAFLMIKRSIVDVELIKFRFPKEAEKFLPNISSLQPKDEDLLGAVEGLLRLQFYYKLQTSDFANGIIDGDQTRSPLSAFDLFVLGEKAMLVAGQDFFALEYLQLVYGKLRQGFDIDSEVSEDVLIQCLIEIYQAMRNYPKAFEMLEELKIKFPEGDEDNYYSFIHQSLRDDQKEFGTNNISISDPFSDSYSRDSTFSAIKDRTVNSRICRGNVTISTEDISKLRCRYVSTNPFSTLARFKVEEALLDPYIVLFIDAVSDDEARFLRDSSKGKLFRGSAGSEDKVTNQRVAQISWHYQYEHKIFRTLSRRVEDMTGLSLTSAEPLQTQNYGIGGHYDGHWDCTLYYDKPFPTDGGNRIATMLFYLSDVAKGGGTVFTYHNLLVSPRKGAAVFWYNLSSSGTCDFKTRHSACPVLLGSKWVSNKWIREHGNEFIKPCIPGQIYDNEGGYAYAMSIY